MPLRLKGYLGVFIVCCVYWILDSIWSFLSFEYNLKNLIVREPSSYVDTLLLRVPPYQIVSRLMVIALLTILGIIILEFFRKRQIAEKDRKQAHDTFLTILNSIDATIYVADMQNHDILFMNQYVIDHYGLGDAGKKCYEIFCHNRQICGNCTNDQLLDESGNPNGVVVSEKKNPITNAWYLNYDRAIKWIDGRIVHLQIATDITRLKELQEKQLEAESHLRQAQKMESIGTLAGGVAHDFNNILYMIMGNAELAMEDIHGSSPAHENLRDITGACKRAAGIIKQLLNFSRKADPERKSVNVIPVIKDALRLMRSTIPASIDIRATYAADELNILADPIQIDQLLINLLTNASQAMEETGGILSISVENEHNHQETPEPFHEKASGEYARITIRDTGQGIDPDDLDRIFDPYFTTKALDKGSGMGLAVVHGIVNNHGGTIAVDSQPGDGTCFTIRFPVIAEKPEVFTESADEIQGGDEKILFVDDEESITNMIRRLLNRLGYQVETKNNPVEAIELFRQQPDAYNLLITDMTMPQMTGLKLSEKLRTIRPDLPVIIFTGYNSLIDETRASAHGINAFVMKPLDTRKMAITVRHVLDGTNGSR
ncbi:MAG: response regulator [Desulfobacteraceae bacterium]|nr:response regulator [Desulfobacteraceae bacterium]